MADFTTTVTDADVLDADEVAQYEDGIIFGYTPEMTIDSVVTVVVNVNGKTVTFPKYANLTAISSVITDGEDVASVALADDVVTLTPGPYGNAVTLQLEADIQSRGHAARAAGFLIGRNAGTSLDGLGIAAADAFAGTVIYPNTASSANTCSTADILDKVFAGRLYNKLARVNVAGIGGTYIGVSHEDNLFDLRNDTQNGGWTDVSKYANPQSVLQNEVGMFNGIRWLRSSNITRTTSTLAYTTKTNVFGFNALGRADSVPLRFSVTGPFDKLKRFLNYGWYWYGVYDTIDANQQIQGITSSSLGSL